MPFIGLFMTAELENIGRIIFPAETDWTLDVSEPSGVDVRERITVNASEELEVPNSKGKANFLVKFEGAKQPASMSVFTPSRKNELKDLKKVTELGVWTPEQGMSVPIAVFECRGLEPSRWYPVGPFLVESDGGTVFPDVDLSDEQGWCDYDEKSGKTVTITDLKWEFKTVR
mmetsp:Transcript_90658/g.270563  ORF Transcript_90658/g.270563 Transcript_90658/m.270563 type:complete len:172 (+) Transcript_90658:77-592(+)